MPSIYHAEGGRIRIEPAIYIAPQPVGAQHLGFSVVHQRLPAMKSGAICYEFTVPHLSVAEHLKFIIHLYQYMYLASWRKYLLYVLRLPTAYEVILFGSRGKFSF